MQLRETITVPIYAYTIYANWWLPLMPTQTSVYTHTIHNNKDMESA